MPSRRKKGPLTEGALFCLSSGGLSAPLRPRPANRSRHTPWSSSIDPERQTPLTDPCQYPARAVEAPPRLPALCVDFHSLERLLPHGCAQHQYWRGATKRGWKTILQNPSKSFTFRHVDLVAGECSCKTRPKPQFWAWFYLFWGLDV